MKKLYLVLFASLFFLIPRSVFATEGFGAANVPWYGSASATGSLPLINGTRYRYQTFSPDSFGWYTTTFYAKMNNTFTAGRFDYVIIDLWTQNGTGDDEVIYYNNTMQYATQGNTTYTQDVVSVYLVQQNTAGGTLYFAPCYPLGQSKSDSIVYNLYCPIYSAATIVHSVKIETYINHVPSTGYSWTWGLSDWYSYHYSGADSNTLQQAIQNQTTNITQAQEDTTNAVNDLTDSLTDSSTNSNTDNQNVINDFNSKLSNNNTISSLITMPLTIFQKILNSVNASCTPFTLGNLLGTNITMPCINLANYLGTTLWNVIDVIISGLFIFSISKTMIKVFNNFTSLKDKGDILGGVD